VICQLGRNGTKLPDGTQIGSGTKTGALGLILILDDKKNMRFRGPVLVY
jgi:hypothetical protein